MMDLVQKEFERFKLNELAAYQKIIDEDLNPWDARFIGSPIDLIVFDGLTEIKEEITIYFIEVKTGKSTLSEAQRKIWQAIVNKRIDWRQITVPRMIWDTWQPPRIFFGIFAA
jgi:predicted Holliday junction resolvase-like endonuclease